MTGVGSLAGVHLRRSAGDRSAAQPAPSGSAGL
jgi:hypothetical protein